PTVNTRNTVDSPSEAADTPDGAGDSPPRSPSGECPAARFLDPPSSVCPSPLPTGQTRKKEMADGHGSREDRDQARKGLALLRQQAGRREPRPQGPRRRQGAEGQAAKGREVRHSPRRGLPLLHRQEGERLQGEDEADRRAPAQDRSARPHGGPARP